VVTNIFKDLDDAEKQVKNFAKAFAYKAKNRSAMKALKTYQHRETLAVAENIAFTPHAIERQLVYKPQFKL